MKNIIKSFAVITAAIAFVSCAKEVNIKLEPITPENTETQVEEKVVEFSTEPITKTVFTTPSGSTVPTIWTNTYCVAVSLNYAAAKKSTTPDVGGDPSTANFSASISDDSSADYNFYALSPYDALVSFNGTNKYVAFDVPTVQTTLAASVDERAQILFAKYDAGDSFPTSVTMAFDHLTAYGKITLKNLSLAAGESISSVALTAAVNWAGRYNYYIEDYSTYSAGDIVENSASKTITVATDRTNDIWFACAPVDLGGRKIDVVVNTNKGTTYAKQITIPAGKVFESGKINSFGINMSGITGGDAVVYKRVEDVSDLTLGSEVIIVAATSDLAISTTQNSNNRGQASVTKSTNALDEAVINSPGAGVQVFTIDNGNVAGTYALKIGSEYLYAVSAQNYLRTTTNQTLDNFGSWYIGVTNAGIATIKSIGTTDIRILKYNSGNSVFSCYNSGQNDVSIYKKVGTGSGAITAKVPSSLSITGATTNYVKKASYSFDGSVKLVFSDTSEETITSSEYTMDASAVNMAVAGDYTITFSYNANPSITGSYTITVGDAPKANFSYTDFSGQGTEGTGSSISATKDTYITISSNLGFGADGHVRIYSGGTITVSASGGKTITKIVFTSTASGTSKNGPSKIGLHSGEAGSYSYSGNAGTWTGSASSVQFDASGQFRFTTVEVTY